MAENKKKINIGRFTFAKLIEDHNYYVDKTPYLKSIIENSVDSMIFTRPRRFGKTLTMDMLKSFFCLNYKNDPGYEKRQRALFEDLAIGQDKEFCREHQGKYPVISLTCSNIRANSYDEMCGLLRNLISRLYQKFDFLEKNPALTSDDLDKFRRGLKVDEVDDVKKGNIILQQSLENLVALLNKCYNQPVIVLIDEYDVPLQCAHHYGYYNEIINVVRNLFSSVAKPDNDLGIFRCVFTGCLRISKESIFTGLNNQKVYSFSSDEYQELFGFTQREIDQLLTYYGLEEKKTAFKEWYDGYDFKGTTVYCPWDVMNYLYDLKKSPQAKPKNYWTGTSGNDIIYEALDFADKSTLELFQKLLDGQTVACKLDEQFSYPEFDKNHSSTQLFTLLCLTGYLTCVGTDPEENSIIKIPNCEIMTLFEDKIKNYFKDKRVSPQFKSDAEDLLDGFVKGLNDVVERHLNDFFMRILSVRNQDRKMAEKIYQLFVAGILGGVCEPLNCEVKAEGETGKGYADLLVINRETKACAILEFKKAEHDSDSDLLRAAVAGLNQIEEKSYYSSVLNFDHVYGFGIGCQGKSCRTVAKTFK